LSQTPIGLYWVWAIALKGGPICACGFITPSEALLRLTAVDEIEGCTVVSFAVS